MDNYTRDPLKYGMMLHRYTPGDNFDELGTVAQYNLLADQLLMQFGYAPLLQGVGIHLYHMDCDSLDDETKRGIVNLQDYNLTKEGHQTASGLYWNREKLQLGVFPFDWSADYIGPYRRITEYGRNRAALTLAHEFGHHAARAWFDVKKPICQELRRLWELNSSPNQTTSGEKVAEDYRALMGTDATRGTFSNGVKYTKADNPKLYTILRLANPLTEKLKDKIIKNVQLYQDHSIQWQEFEIVTIQLLWFSFTYTKYIGTFRMGHDFIVGRVQ
jgi:hypothetical protein